jgi:hypothetical protein
MKRAVSVAVVIGLASFASAPSTATGSELLVASDLRPLDTLIVDHEGQADIDIVIRTSADDAKPGLQDLTQEFQTRDAAYQGGVTVVVGDWNGD